MGLTGSARKLQLPNYYALLGVDLESTFRTIEAAYWARVTSEEYRDQIALLNEAYEVLGHTDRRAGYDAQQAVLAEQAPDDEPEAGHARRGNPGLRRKLQWYLQ